jgi:hypothetical protein
MPLWEPACDPVRPARGASRESQRDSWRTVAPIPGRCHPFAVTTSIDGLIYAMGDCEPLKPGQQFGCVHSRHVYVSSSKGILVQRKQVVGPAADVGLSLVRRCGDPAGTESSRSADTRPIAGTRSAPSNGDRRSVRCISRAWRWLHPLRSRSRPTRSAPHDRRASSEGPGPEPYL